MQKKLFSMLALLLTAVIVVGCNTSDKTEQSEVEQQEPSNSQQPSDNETAGDDKQETPTTNDTQQTEEPTTPQQEVHYVQKGVDKKETASESKSEGQSFKFQKLPEFTLSQEEPGKDMLVSNADDEVFMRIETTNTSETSYDAVKTSMQDYMNAVGSPVALSSEELSAFKDIKNIEGYVVNFDTEKVIGVVFEKDGLITKLTIHDNDEQDLTAAMLAMAATISKK